MNKDNNLPNQHEKNNTRQIGSILSHELTTPLIAIKTGASVVGEYVRKLVEAYNIACKEKLNIPQLTTEDLQTLFSCLENIENEASTSNFIVYLISSILKTSIETSKYEALNIKEVLNSALTKISSSIKHKTENCHIETKIDDDLIWGYKKPLITVFCILIYDILRSNIFDHDLNLSITSSIEGEFLFLKIQHNALQEGREQAVSTEDVSFDLSFCETVLNAIGGQLEKKRLQENYFFKIKLPRSPNK